MNNELPPDDVRAVWQGQFTEPLQLSLDEIRTKSNQFQRNIRRRNLREYIAAVFVIVIFSWYAWSAETTVARIGRGLVVAGTFYVIHRLRASNARATYVSTT